jgi:DNA-binding beta-propeller fold protein YncE
VVHTLALDLPGARASDITPVGLLIGRDGRRAYVALGRANHVAFIDVASRRITDRVLVGRRAWSLALNQDESRLYVVNGLSDDLTVVDVPAARALSGAGRRVPHSVVLY